MDVSRLSQGLKIAGIAAIVLFITLFLTWYTAEFEGAAELGITADTSQGASLFDASSFFGVLILICVVAIVGLILAIAAGSTPSLPVAPQAIIAGAAILALLLVVIRFLLIPDGGDLEDLGYDVGRGIGAWIGLIAAIATTVGGVMAMNQSGTSFGGEADRLRGSGSSGSGGTTGGTGGTGGTPAA